MISAKKYSKEWYKEMEEESKVKWAAWREKWQEENACSSCGEQKVPVQVGTSWEHCPKSLPTAIVTQQCKTEGCGNFHEGDKW